MEGVDVSVIHRRPASVASRFFAPLWELLELCDHSRRCPELPDDDWLQAGVQRVLSDSHGGRAFLQFLRWRSGAASQIRPRSLKALQSGRRLALCRELNAKLCSLSGTRHADPLARFPQLDDFELHACDADSGTSAAALSAADGHPGPGGAFYSLDLRTQMLSHLRVRDHAHHPAMRAESPLPRRRILFLREGHRTAQAPSHLSTKRPVYHFSAEPEPVGSPGKEGTAPSQLFFDGTDPLNACVQADETVGAGNGVRLRRVTFTDIRSGQIQHFLGNEMTIPPGLIVHLLRMRRASRNRFDEISSKFGMAAAWAESPTARSMQAQFICLTRNLLHHFEPGLLL